MKILMIITTIPFTSLLSLLDIFCRKRAKATDEFGKVTLGENDREGEEGGTSEVEAVLVARSEEVRKKASAMDAVISICKVGNKGNESK